MKTITSSFLKASLKGIAVSQLFLFLLITASSGQETQKNVKGTNTEDESWTPVLAKHKAEIKGTQRTTGVHRGIISSSSLWLSCFSVAPQTYSQPFIY
jgi:hypothetical protein